MKTTILFHDGCQLCLSIEARFHALLANAPGGFESVNLGQDPSRGPEAAQRGVVRLPSLVVEGQVLRLDDHSPLSDYLA